MAELADALDSGSSGHCARAGSSPVIRRNAENTIDKSSVVFLFAFLEEEYQGFRLWGIGRMIFFQVKF